LNQTVDHPHPGGLLENSVLCENVFEIGRKIKLLEKVIFGSKLISGFAILCTHTCTTVHNKHNNRGQLFSQQRIARNKQLLVSSRNLSRTLLSSIRTRVLLVSYFYSF
jgi:hypothetical protein